MIAAVYLLSLVELLSRMSGQNWYNYHTCVILCDTPFHLCRWTTSLVVWASSTCHVFKWQTLHKNSGPIKDGALASLLTYLLTHSRQTNKA